MCLKAEDYFDWLIRISTNGLHKSMVVMDMLRSTRLVLSRMAITSKCNLFYLQHTGDSYNWSSKPKLRNLTVIFTVCGIKTYNRRICTIRTTF